MLRVGGEQLHPVLRGQRQDGGPPSDQRLLVGQADVLSGPDGSARRLEASTPDDARHDRVRVAVRGRRDRTLVSRHDLRLRGNTPDQLFKFCDLRRVLQGDQ